MDRDLIVFPMGSELMIYSSPANHIPFVMTELDKYVNETIEMMCSTPIEYSGFFSSLCFSVQV